MKHRHVLCDNVPLGLTVKMPRYNTRMIFCSIVFVRRRGELEIITGSNPRHDVHGFDLSLLFSIVDDS